MAQMLEVRDLDLPSRIFTNRTWYLSTILHRISNSQASVLLNLGIIDDLQQKSVEKGRKDVEKSLKRLRKLAEVADCEQERSCFRESCIKLLWNMSKRSRWNFKTSVLRVNLCFLGGF